jgi:hypothetical protein
MRHLLKRKGQPASSWPARAVHQCHSPPVPGQLFDIATHACHQGCAGERTEVMCGVSSRSRAPQSGCSQQQQTAMAPLPGQQTTQQATVFCALVRCCNPADFDEGGGWGWGVGWGWVCGGGGGVGRAHLPDLGQASSFSPAPASRQVGHLVVAVITGCISWQGSPIVISSTGVLC